jgi:hypothetical protein
MEGTIQMIWTSTTSWDYVGAGKIKVNYIIK